MNYWQFLARYPKTRPRAFLYAISGDDTPSRDDAIDRIIKRHRPSDLDFYRGEVKNETQALKILAQEPTRGHRLVVLSDFEAWGERQFLGEWLDSRKFANIVPVFISNRKSPKTDSLFAQTIIRKGWWIVTHRPSREQIIEFCRSTYNVSEPVATLISDVVGTDLARVRNIILKLQHMTDGKPPTLRDVEEAALGYQSTAFATVDALVDRKRARVLQLVDMSQIPSVLTLMRRKVEQIIQVRSLMQQDEMPVRISEQTNIPLFLVPGLMEKAKTVSFDRAASILTEIALADVDIHVHRYDPATVFTRMVTRL